MERNNFGCGLSHGGCCYLVVALAGGRDYFPDAPKPYFRLISVFMIAPVVFMLFSPYLRQEIVHKLKTLALPICPLGLVILGLLISDAVEHSRSLSFLFLYDLAYKDFIEEVYEFLLILGLFLTAYPWMQQDHVPQELEVMQYHKE
ncbi:hypothetical protein [Acinetobacter sp. YH12063]|uniref:hypothetical protein n=1 Tax=Acinetobacter sp. YH12063 TaxID=2601061 RepID=UPI00211E6E7B|nr:hypothetical protein [Acinetobacter sp. YH12063]